MKIKKLLFTSVVLAFVFLLGACQPEHVHTYSDEYTYNETQHWFAATCEHNEEKNEVEDHNFSSWTTKTSKTCTTDEVLSRTCLTCFYEETKVGAKAGHTLQDVKGTAATCETDGVKAHKHCTVCNKNFDNEGKELSSVTISKLGHSKLDEWQHDENNHYKVCSNNGCVLTFDVSEHTYGEWETKTPATCSAKEVQQRTCSVCSYVETKEVGDYANHTLTDVAETPKTCTTDGIKAHKHCSVCEKDFDAEGNVLSATDLIIQKSHNLSDVYVINELTHKANCLDCEHFVEEEHEHDENTGLCVCGKELQLTLLASHSGNNTWSLTDDEKITTSAIILENISSVEVSEGKLVNFEHYIVYKGWGSDYEAYNLYINSSNDVLTLKLQLGREPWTVYGTYTLGDEHKDRIASESGLDFVLHFNKETNKLSGYVYTNHQLDKLFEITCYSTISNFYEVGYKTNSGTFGTLTTSIYKSYDTSVNEIFNVLNIALTEHNLQDVVAVTPTCEEDGIVAHKHCSVCLKNYDSEGVELSTIVDPKTGHNYSTELTKGETTHYYVCLNANCDSKSDEEPHNMVFTSTKVPATEEVEGIEIWTCSGCGKQEERNIGKLADTHTYKDSYSYDGTSHWYDSTCGHDVKGGLQDHTFNEYEEVPPTCNETGTIAYKECSVCHAKYDLEGNEVDDLTINATGHSYSEEWTKDETYHWHEATCEHSTLTTEKVEHEYSDLTGLCECGKELQLTLLASHSGNNTWSLADDEKITTSAIIHENISNAVVSEGKLDDFEHYIVYKGYSSVYEPYYLYINSSNDVLTLKLQLGREPWTVYGTYTLGDEHKDRIASESGLDFVLHFNKETNKLSGYVYTNHQLDKLFEITCYSTISNFYEVGYKTNSGTFGTLTTSIYKSYDTSVNEIFNVLNIALTEHTLVDVEATSASCDTNGIPAHKECTICGIKVDDEQNEIDSIIPMTGHTYVDGVCSVCSKVYPFTQVSSHLGTSEWNMAADEKLASNALIHQNVSNVSKNGDELADFSLQIQYRGWENNGERTYFYTIKSVNGVLTIDNQLGIAPWSFTTFTLSDEHKAALASEEGLDFYVHYDHTNQKLKLYIATNGSIELLHTLNTYYGSMSNFYKFRYTLTGTATVNTYTYTVSNNFDVQSDLKNM